MTNRVVRIGLPLKARDGSHQDEGLTGEKGFEIRVNDAEREFLFRLAERSRRCATRGQGIMFVQDMEEA